MSIVVSTINKVGEDYNTLTLWEDAKDGDLVAATTLQEADCYDDDGTLSDTVTVDGSTTSADYYMIITVPVTDRHNGTSATGFLLQGSSNAVVLKLYDDYAVCEWIKLRQQQGSGKGGIITNTNYVRISNNLIYDVKCELSYAGIRVAYSTAPTYIYNNIIYNMTRDDDNDAGSARGIVADGSGVDSSPLVYNNTVYNCFDSCIVCNGGGGGGGKLIAKNNIAFTPGVGGVCLSTNFNTASDYNATTDATGDDYGANGLINLVAADNLTNLTANEEDLHLKLGADCIDEGVDLGTGAFSFDIDNRDRDAEGDIWDIGADEYVASEGEAAVPRGFMTTQKGFW